MRSVLSKNRNQLLCLCFMLMSCAQPKLTDEVRVVSRFDHPQTVRLLDESLIVVNSSYDALNWGPGYINLIDPDNLSEEIRITTSAANPQNIQFESGWMMVVETGIYDFSDFDQPRSAPPFGIELFSYSDTNRIPPIFIQLPQQVDEHAISAPVELRTINSVTLVTSGLFNIVWRIKWSDIEAGTVEHIEVLRLERELTTGLGNMVVWNDHFLLTDFNRDRLYVINQDGTEIKCRVELGTNAEEMEGLQTPLVIEQSLWVTFAFSGHIERINLNPLVDECRLEKNTLPVILGQVPNDLDRVNDEVWVTMSGENNLLRLDLNSGEELGEIVLPVASNPWAFDFNEARQLGAVSLWAMDEVYLIDQDGRLEFRLNEDIQRN